MRKILKNVMLLICFMLFLELSINNVNAAGESDNTLVSKDSCYVVKPSTISIQIGETANIRAGHTSQFAELPSGDPCKGKAYSMAMVYYSSDNTEVATVTKTGGVVTGKKVGSAKITASYEGKTVIGYSYVTVIPSPEIYIGMKINAGETITNYPLKQLSQSYNVSNVSYAKLSCSNSNQSVSKFVVNYNKSTGDGDVKITGIKAGNSKVTCQYDTTIRIIYDIEVVNVTIDKPLPTYDNNDSNSNTNDNTDSNTNITDNNTNDNSNTTDNSNTNITDNNTTNTENNTTNVNDSNNQKQDIKSMYLVIGAICALMAAGIVFYVIKNKGKIFN